MQTGAAAVGVAVKRAYEKPSLSDGARVLVDRHWPRGLARDTARIDEWLRDLAPSDLLREWFQSRPAQWPMFRRRYLKELCAPAAAASLEQLYDLRNRRRQLTLLSAARDPEHNSAAILKELLEGMRKPPSSSGPARAAAVRARARNPRSR